MYLSVIIPTYNRKKTLKNTIESLLNQTYPEDKYELVIADDGSNDGTKEMISNITSNVIINYYWQKNRGRAAARNLGIKNSKGDLLLFIDSDMLAEESLLSEHTKEYQNYKNIMVIGNIKLSKTIKRTPFVRTVLEKENKIENRSNEKGFIPNEFCLTGNLSIRKKDLEKIGFFDEKFKEYGWEDTVFGYKARDKGIRILCNPDAIAYHEDYATNLRAHCRRWERASESAAMLFRKYPEMKKYVPMFEDKECLNFKKDPAYLIFKKIIRKILAFKLILAINEKIISLLEKILPLSFALKPYYKAVISAYIYKGYHKGLEGLDGI